MGEADFRRMLRKVLSFDESSPLLSTAAGGTEVVVSVDAADGAGEARLSIDVLCEVEAEVDMMMGGVSILVATEVVPTKVGGEALLKI